MYLLRNKPINSMWRSSARESAVGSLLRKEISGLQASTQPEIATKQYRSLQICRSDESVYVLLVYTSLIEFTIQIYVIYPHMALVLPWIYANGRRGNVSRIHYSRTSPGSCVHFIKITSYNARRTFKSSTTDN